MDSDTPAAPPEARLIRTAREAAGMTAAQAARATGGAVSAIYWRNVERGYGGRRGVRAPARASARLLAIMARTTGGVTPDQLAAAQREDAARVLAEIERQGGGPPAAAQALLRAVPSPAAGDRPAVEVLIGLLASRPDDEELAAEVLAGLASLYPDDEVIALMASKEYRPPADRVKSIKNWLTFLEAQEGDGERGTSAG